MELQITSSCEETYEIASQKYPIQNTNGYSHQTWVGDNLVAIGRHDIYHQYMDEHQNPFTGAWSPNHNPDATGGMQMGNQ